MKSKIKISDIFAYLLGNYRFALYISDFKFLLRSHIIEQYEWRLTKMNPECYTSGSCVKCGCDTPALQMANKACKGGCYFEMYSKKKWKAFKEIVAKRNAITRPLDLLLENLEENDSEEEYVWPIMYKKEVPQYVMGFDPITSNKDSVGVDTTTFNITMREPWSPENKKKIMNYFKEQTIDFGSVKRNTSKEIIFTAERNIPKVIDITVSCGCTKVKWYEESRILKVTYKAGEIPNQVIDNQDITKTVTLYYKNGNEETLTIKGIKTR